MENAAMAAYLKDVENNTKDITAERMISEKLNKTQELNVTQNPNLPPPAAPETNPRFRGKTQHRLPSEIDPCDPAPQPRPAATHARIGIHGTVGRTGGTELRTQGKCKPSKGKGKGKKTQEDDRPNKLDSRKAWYEALSPEGYSYYWHIETNESMWDPPEEGFMTIAEQEEEAKEQAVQEEFFEQIDKEVAKKKAEILEEQRANGERERLREIRKQRECEQSNEEEEEEQKTTYRRDYSVPEKSQPYGSWQTVQIIEKAPVNLQLPEQKFTPLALPTLQNDSALPSKTFKEKTITHITTGITTYRDFALNIGETGRSMAWHCNGATNREMVQKLKAAGILGTERAEAAMLAVDRANYCHESDPYLDCPRRIGYNVTISAPHMHAYALTVLTDQLKDGARALDVGSGSGYLTACMAHMVDPRGLVIGLEHISELIEIAGRNVFEDCPRFIKENRIKFVVGDGRLGHAIEGPYDAIHVGAAADTLPQELINQLAPGGRLICPVVALQGLQRYQDLVQVDKNLDGSITKKKLMQVSYVPLTDASIQLRNLNTK